MSEITDQGEILHLFIYFYTPGQSASLFWMFPVFLAQQELHVNAEMLTCGFALYPDE